MNQRQKQQIDRLKDLLEAMLELKSLARQRKNNYVEASKKRLEVLRELTKIYKWLLDNDVNTWQILEKIGLQYENNLYGIKRQFRHKEIDEKDK